MLESVFNVKNNYCSCSGPGFGIQLPQGSSQFSLTPVAQELALFWPLQTLSVHDTYMKTNTHIYNFFKLKKFCFFLLRQSCSASRPDWPQSHRDLPSSTTWMLGLKACAPLPIKKYLLKNITLKHHVFSDTATRGQECVILMHHNC